MFVQWNVEKTAAQPRPEDLPSALIVQISTSTLNPYVPKANTRKVAENIRIRQD
jgi:hypothetical protein